MLNHKGTKTIETNRLILRKFEVTDSKKMFENWANDSNVTRYLTWLPHESEEVTKNLLSLWCKEYERDDYYNWVITLDGEAIGNVSVVRQNEKTGELGYCMGKAFWGKGIMTEVVKSVCDYLFDEVGFEKLIIRHAKDNPASGRVAQKCGMKVFDIAEKGYVTSDGRVYDIVSLSLERKNRK